MSFSLVAGDGMRLTTVALRLAAIYGEQDSITAFYLKRYKFLPRFGHKNSKMQHAYAGNLAWAHVVANQALAQDSSLGGQVYYITDDTPVVNRFDFIEILGSETGIYVTRHTIPKSVTYLIAFIAMIFIYLISPIYSLNADWNIDLLSYMVRTKTFRRTKAEKMLGYKPLFSYEESIAATTKFYKYAYYLN